MRRHFFEQGSRRNRPREDRLAVEPRRAPQKTLCHRTLQNIRGRITVRVCAVWVLGLGAACGPSVVTLGLGGAQDLESADVSGARVSSANNSVPPESPAGADGGSSLVGVAVSQPATAGMGGNAGAEEVADAGAGGMSSAHSPGCGLLSPASDASIQIAGSTTSYLVDLATDYDPNRPYPLVVALRGADVTASAFRRYLNLPPVVGADGIIVSLECADNASSWDVERDLPMFDAMLIQVQSQYCIDLDRIFVVGHATGAMFANSLACMRSDVLRGLGSLSGAAPVGACAGKIAAWITQGNADSSVTLGRGNRDFWARQDGCNPNVQHQVEPPPCVAYDSCDSGFPVHYCEYAGNLNLPSFAAAGVWAFFQSL